VWILYSSASFGIRILPCQNPSPLLHAALLEAAEVTDKLVARLAALPTYASSWETVDPAHGA
jgi:hypothetical protein